MFLVSFTDGVPMMYEKSSGHNLIVFEPFRPYVMSNDQFRRIEGDHSIVSKFYKISQIGSRIPNFNASLEKPGRVFFHTGGGGFGDQIMAWPVAKYLATRGYTVDVFADPGNEYCWWLQKWIGYVGIIPVSKYIFDNYKHYALFESVTNMDEHSDQQHPVDVMFKKIGIDPMSVPAEEKVVRPEFSPFEINRTHEFFSKIPQKRYAFLQFTASAKLRSLSVNEAFAHMKALATAYPDIAWIHLSDKFNDSGYKIKVQESGLPNLFAHSFDRLRECWCAIAQAEVVVAVDSMVVHAAGTSAVPCVGLWGPVSPDVRVKYYKNHVPLFSKSACPHSPCFYSIGADLPTYCPPSDDGQRPSSCRVMQAATPEVVLNAVESILSKKRLQNDEVSA